MSILLKILVNEKLAYEIENPETEPDTGGFIGVPTRLQGVIGSKELYVGKIIKRYPDKSMLDEPTIVECQCALV